MRLTAITHEFVDYVPTELDEGVLYISTRYTTASHLCACGCGLKVVTPIRPAQWHLLFDGDTVSLFPSVGSHQFPCRSHYFIRRGRIQWERPWSEERAEFGWRGDEADLANYYDLDDEREHTVATGAASDASGDIWRKLRGWLGRRGA